MRSLKGLRGFLVNAWDRFQGERVQNVLNTFVCASHPACWLLAGWLIVTITGILTAFIAGGIVMSEAVLFDLKDGYCHRNWRLAKRFCCPCAEGQPYDEMPPNVTITAPTSPASWSYTTGFMSGNDPTKGLLTGMGNRLLAGWAGPVAGSPVWATMKSPIMDGGLGAEEECPGWVTWGEAFARTGEDNWAADYAMYVLVAVSTSSRVNSATDALSL